MTSLRKTTAALALASIAMLGLAACGGSSGDATASASLPASAMASTLASPSSGAIVGDDPATWAPIILKKGTKTIEMVTRQVAIWPKLEYAKNPDYTAVSSDASVVEVLPADNGTVVGFRAVAPGEAVVKVYANTDATGKAVRKVKVTVTE